MVEPVLGSGMADAAFHRVCPPTQHGGTCVVMIKRFPAAALLLAALFFGIAPTGTKYVLSRCGPVTTLTVALVSATLVLWTLLFRRGYRRPQSWVRVMILGALEPGI